MENFDIALLKETHLSESKVMEFRMERHVAAPDASGTEIPILMVCLMTLATN